MTTTCSSRDPQRHRGGPSARTLLGACIFVLSFGLLIHSVVRGGHIVWERERSRTALWTKGGKIGLTYAGGWPERRWNERSDLRPGGVPVPAPLHRSLLFIEYHRVESAMTWPGNPPLVYLVTTGVSVPLAYFALAGALVATHPLTTRMFARVRRGQRLAQGRCVRCGYQLVGGQRVCSECGTPLSIEGWTNSNGS